MENCEKNVDVFSDTISQEEEVVSRSKLFTAICENDEAGVLEELKRGEDPNSSKHCHVSIVVIKSYLRIRL